MLNRSIVIAILVSLNFVLDSIIGFRYGLSSLNNWLLIISCGLLSLAIYRLLGMVEGYKS